MAETLGNRVFLISQLVRSQFYKGRNIVIKINKFSDNSFTCHVDGVDCDDICTEILFDFFIQLIEQYVEEVLDEMFETTIGNSISIKMLDFNLINIFNFDDLFEDIREEIDLIDQRKAEDDFDNNPYAIELFTDDYNIYTLKAARQELLLFTKAGEKQIGGNNRIITIIFSNKRTNYLRMQIHSFLGESLVIDA
jgi:hypothetical protein